MNLRSLSRRAGIVRLVFAILAIAIASAPFAASNVVEYSYDAAGNIVQIARQPSPGFAITSFDPVSGPVGTTVTVYGTGFSATPANNTVKFNGTTATVSASDSGSISTTVPAGATTGRITVTVSGNTATSATDFLVTIPGVPNITSFTPSSGVAGTSVSVTGANFDPATNATTVKLNGVIATSSVASATSLTFSVPGATASGRITATTSGGTGASVTDFIVPPPGVIASEIATTIRIAANGPTANLAIGTANTRGLVLFDGTADTYYSVQFGQPAITPSSSVVPYTVIKPDNTVLMTGNIAYNSDTSRPTILLPKLPATGTYSVVVSPGIATFNSNVKLVADPVITIDGGAASFTLDTATQAGRVVFNATAGQRIGLGVVGLTLAPLTTGASAFSVYNPDGTQLGTSASCLTAAGGSPQGNCDGEFLTTTAGIHTIVGRLYVGTSGGFGVQVSSEVTGSLVADTGADITLARVGQDARLTFTANAGDNLGFALSGITPQPQAQLFYATVYKPDGSTFLQTNAMAPNGAYLEMGTLATAGTYTVFLDPTFGTYGTARFTLKQGTILGSTDAAAAFAPATISEAARFRFSGTAGQNLAVGVIDIANVGGSTSASLLNVYAPDRTSLASVTCTPNVASGRCKATLTNLPSTGTYSVVVVPPSAGVKITGSVSISADLTGTLVAGTPQTITASRDGQNARYTFSGTAGDNTSVKVYGIATTPASQTLNAKIYRPDGTLLTSGSGTSTSPFVVTLASLPSTGTYTVLLEPFYGVTWSATLALDPGVLVTVDGATQTLANSAAGEPLRYRFSGTAGQRMEWGIGGLTYATLSANGTTLNIYQPSGSQLTSQTCYTTGTATCELSYGSLPATGTYSAAIIPPSASTITAGTFAVSTPLSGTFVVGNPAQTVAITRPGQTARYTFSGTSGQLLRLNWSSVTVSGGATVSVSILKPDNTTLTSSSFANGANSGVDIASLSSTGTYTVVLDPSSGATMSASMSLVTR